MTKVKVVENKGRLILSEICFDKVCRAVVKTANENCGRIYLPKDWIGKTVYAVLKEV